MARWIIKNALAVVSLFAYLMLSLMIVGQARIIETQKTLIHELYGDSLALTAVRANSIVKHRQSK